MNQTTTIQTTNEPKLSATPVDDTHETISQFDLKVRQAQVSGEKWVETTKEIMLLLNRGKLNDKLYFTYSVPGVIVCENGKRAEAEAVMNRDLNKAAHGEGEGVVARK